MGSRPTLVSCLRSTAGTLSIDSRANAAKGDEEVEVLDFEMIGRGQGELSALNASTRKAEKIELHSAVEGAEETEAIEAIVKREGIVEIEGIEGIKDFSLTEVIEATDKREEKKENMLIRKREKNPKIKELLNKNLMRRKIVNIQKKNL